MAQFDLQIRDIYGQVVGTWKPLDCELSVTQNDTGSLWAVSVEATPQ